MHGSRTTIHHFLKELATTIKPSLLSMWKGKYVAEMNRKVKAGEKDDTGDVGIKTLPVKRRGRPLLLGESLDNEVKSYMGRIHKDGGVITTSIVIAAATAIVRRHDKTLLVENGGHLRLINH